MYEFFITRRILWQDAPEIEILLSTYQLETTVMSHCRFNYHSSFSVAKNEFKSSCFTHSIMDVIDEMCLTVK